MSTLSTHVLDSSYGEPAAGVTVVLFGPDGSELETVQTDADGRARFAAELGPGTHGLGFDTGAYFTADAREAFYPMVSIGFDIDPARPHHHVALLVSPYSYTTYRGS